MGSLPGPDAGAHKYDRGHAVVVGAESLTGATRLAATGCSRIGAGLVTVLASDATADVYRSSLPADIMVSTADLADLRRVNVVLAGPGGVSTERAEQLNALGEDVPVVLDAAAIALADVSSSERHSVLTPHGGEFANEFPDIVGDVVEQARAAAMRRHSVVVLKGSRTAISDPHGHATMHDRPNPYLAKAGTGDVLAGFIAGLVAQGMPLFDAANAGVWLHGEAGSRVGVGLVAPDLERQIPAILRDLHE